MKYRNSFLNLTLLIAISLFITGCKNKSLAPKSIKGYTIGCYTDVTVKADTQFLKKFAYYIFNHDETYKLTFEGKTIYTGNYSYRRIDHSRAEVVFTDSFQEHNDTYTLFLKFMTPDTGYWRINYTASLSSEYESGDFKIVKEPS